MIKKENRGGKRENAGRATDKTTGAHKTCVTLDDDSKNLCRDLSFKTYGKRCLSLGIRELVRIYQKSQEDK